MSRLKKSCDNERNIPNALTEDDFHLPGRKWKKLEELSAHKELEQLGQIYFALLAREKHEKQDMPERNLNNREKRRRDVKPDTQN